MRSPCHPETEVWLPIVGSPWCEVSSCGRVRSARGRILRPYPRGAGYLGVRLGGRRGGQVYVHRLVALAFHGEPDRPSDHVDHRDFNVTNNHAANLRWLAAHLNLGRHVRYGPRGWERVGDEEPPQDHTPLAPAERAAIDDQLARAGW